MTVAVLKEVTGPIWSRTIGAPGALPLWVPTRHEHSAPHAERERAR
jgi:hypothetical protein